MCILRISSWHDYFPLCDVGIWSLICDVRRCRDFLLRIPGGTRQSLSTVILQLHSSVSRNDLECKHMNLVPVFTFNTPVDVDRINQILPLQSGGGTWGTALYTVRGVVSGSRDVDAWRVNVSVPTEIPRGSGDPSTDDPGACQHCGDSMLRQRCPAPRKTWPES